MSAAETTIRAAKPDDAETIKDIAVQAEMFSRDEVDLFDEILAGFFDGSMEGHQWLVAKRADDDTIIAAAYYAPEPFSDRMWNLYFLAVSPDHQGGGAGAALVAHIERSLRQAGDATARTLIVDTSSTDKYARTREFYARVGFVEEARVRQFYGPDDDKVTFWKSLA